MEYLEFAMWASKNSKHKEGQAWVRVDCDWFTGPQLSTLSWAQRSVTVALWLARGAYGHPLPYDYRWLSRACRLDRVYASILHRTVTVLLSLGVLLLCNQHDDPIRTNERTNERTDIRTYTHTDIQSTPGSIVKTQPQRPEAHIPGDVTKAKAIPADMLADMQAMGLVDDDIPF